MPATLDPSTERIMSKFGPLVNYLKRVGILTNAGVAASTSVSDLIADAYAALRSGTIELRGPEVTNAVRRFEQHIRHMEKRGLITDVLVAALTTVNTASASTDLRYLVSNVLSDTTLDMTGENTKGFEFNYAYGLTR